MNLTNQTNMDDLYIMQAAKQATFWIYSIAFFVGTIGNTLTIIVIVKSKKLRTVATTFILNLAIADDFFLLCAPFMIYNSYYNTWPFGKAICHLMYCSYTVNLFSSTYTMVLMSVDRYLAIVQPFESRR